MSDADLRKGVGFKGKKASFEGFKRNIRQITFTQEHRKGSANIVVAKYKSYGFKGAKLKQLEKDLTKTAGSSFISISQELEKIGFSKEMSYKRASFLLKIPKSKYNLIQQSERDILADYGT